MRWRRRRTDGTSVAPVGGNQEQRTEKDIVPSREVTADRLRINATRLWVIQEKIVERSQDREKIILLVV